MVDFDTVLVAFVSAAAPTIIGVIGVLGANSRLNKQLEAQQERTMQTAKIQSRKEAQQYFRDNFEVFKKLFAAASSLQIIREWLTMITPQTLNIEGLLLSTQQKWDEVLKNFMGESKALRSSGWTLLLPKKLDALVQEIEAWCVGAQFLHWATKEKAFDPASITLFLTTTNEISKKLDELRSQIQEIWGLEMLTKNEAETTTDNAT